MKIDLTQHLPFLISLLIFSLCLIILFIRKWINDKNDLIRKDLGKFSKSVIDNIHAQANLNQKILSKPENEDLKKEYDIKLEGIKEYRPYKKDELDSLYIFDPENPHKDNILNYEPN